MKTVLVSISSFLLFSLTSCADEVCTQCAFTSDLFGSPVTENHDEQCGTEVEIANYKAEIQALEDELTKDGNDLNARIVCVDQ